MATSQLVNYIAVSAYFMSIGISVTHKAKSLRNAVGSSSGLRWLHFTGVNLADDAPCGGIRERKGKDEHDDEPSACSTIGANAI